MQVLKFGGSSVANAENISKVVDIIQNAIKKDKTILVSSAISGCTDTLLNIGHLASIGDESYTTLIKTLENKHEEIINLLIPKDDHKVIKEKVSNLFRELEAICYGVFTLKELSNRSENSIVSFGELFSTSIISAKFSSLAVSHRWIDSRNLIKTEYINSQNIVLKDISDKLIQDALLNNPEKLYILPGFIASDTQGAPTTLGRGGSDYTASLMAVATKSRVLEIWTDVSGMMTADPRIVPDAKTIDNISYKEALELSHFGAKVVYPPTIHPVVSEGIPIYIKNTFEPLHKGTLIESNPPEGISNLKGISSSNSIALISMAGSGMIGIPGYSSRLFATLTDKGINIILITQATSAHTMCVAIDQKDAPLAKKAIDETFAYEISLGKVEPLKVELGFSIISLVGDDMKNLSGTSGRMFDALGNEGINIRAIAQGSSEKNVSTVVHTEQVELAIKAIHREFFTDNTKDIHIYIAGVGVVGGALIQIIQENSDRILTATNKRLVVCGISNSKGYLINKAGINLNTFDTNTLEYKGDFISECCALRQRNAIFIDCTSSREVALRYADILDANIAISTCNKIAGSANSDIYNSIKNASCKSGKPWYYETTVGAALPIIGTMQQMVNSGDKVYRFEAILSGTLNYLFSTYDGSTPFAEVVAAAKEAGYTEPDPRADLSGMDVLRKATILARELGLSAEQSDFSIEGIELDNGEAYFAELLQKAQKENKNLRYIVNYPEMTIGLKAIGRDHPFYEVNGTNNAIILESDYYPLGIKIEGAGAGARQTALGLFNEILK